MALTPLVLIFGRFESNARNTSTATWRLLVGAVLVCGGLALIALNGVVVDGLLSLRSWVLLLPFVGALIAGVLPTRKKDPRG